MDYAELIYELKRLATFAESLDYELANDLNNVINQYDTTIKGECSCGA
jgi:hypothetical protein